VGEAWFEKQRRMQLDKGFGETKRRVGGKATCEPHRPDVPSLPKRKIRGKGGGVMILLKNRALFNLKTKGKGRSIKELGGNRRGRKGPRGKEDPSGWER